MARMVPRGGAAGSGEKVCLVHLVSHCQVPVLHWPFLRCLLRDRPLHDASWLYTITLTATRRGRAKQEEHDTQHLLAIACHHADSYSQFPWSPLACQQRDFPGNTFGHPSPSHTMTAMPGPLVLPCNVHVDVAVRIAAASSFLLICIWVNVRLLPSLRLLHNKSG